jgi:N-carbamoyl-L-amino-acid hydrolase
MLNINDQRLLNDLDELARIGSTGDGGVSRPALSPADVEGRAWFKRQIEAAGLEFHQDGTGNLSGVLRCADPQAKTLILGSHLDSVPNGGRFDGALGVLSALEVVRTLKEAGTELPFHVEALSFTDEEGSVLGLMGSQAMAGLLTADDLARPRGGLDALEAGMARIDVDENSILNAQRDPQTLAGYIEVHIEQGTRLEEAGIDIGVVTAMVGIRSFNVQFLGEAAHAGTMPMLKRRDALWGGSDYILRAKRHVMDDYTPGVVNFGQINAKPGAFNIVPAQVDLALEFRHGTDEEMDAMQRDLLAMAATVAQEHGLSVRTSPLDTLQPAPMDATMMAAIETAADALGLSHTRLLSFAGHDAQIMSRITPSVLYFVPSVKGISHNPAEYTAPEDCINGANVMLHAVLALASG